MNEHRWARLAALTLIGLVCLVTNACLSSEGVVAPTLRGPTVEPTQPPTLGATLTRSRPQPTASETPVPDVTPTGTSLPTVTATAIPEPTPSGAPERLSITVLYDNNPYDERLETAWGFSCLVQGLEKTILFDTGGDSAMLLRNMQKLGLDPGMVEIIVLSHIHYDHVGGLGGFLAENNDVAVYLPRSLPDEIKNTVRQAGARLVEVDKPVKICELAYSTGELGKWIREQSLVIETGKGLGVITGCAHPGVVNVVQEAKSLLQKDVHLVLGGFHLCWMNAFQVKGVVEGVKREGVARVAPCHCSGDLARSTFEKIYGEDFLLAGVGRTLEVEMWRR